MAKFGEGDSRWIVQDRPDGTNVHNWHWSETDCLEYSRTFLTSSFSNLPLLTSPTLSLTATSLTSLSGEAYVNIRKGKIIPGYELALSLALAGEAKTREGDPLLEITGVVEIPYLADENAGEVPEMRISINDDGPVGKAMREAFLETGKRVVVDKIKEYEEAMKRGGPCKDDIEAKKAVTPVAKREVKGEVKEEGKKEEGKKKEVKKKEEKERKGYRTIKLSEKFRCRSADLYEIMLDENRWKGFTQSNAKISKEVGGEISIFDGSVVGSNVELKEGKSIVQKWRFGSWPDGVFSTVKLTFEEPEPGVTVVKLVQTDVPEEDRYGNETVVENTERGWRDLIFQRIRAIFGFGL